MLTILRITVLVLIVATMITGLMGSAIALPIAGACVVVGVFYMLGAIICMYLPYAWTCDWAGTHLPEGKSSFDGCSQHSKCRKCGQDIMLDGQGNWF